MKLFKSLLLLCALLTLPLAAHGQGFDLQGHRGARGLMPENTLPAFARALAIGVSTLELDVGVTRDGRLVVSHDSVLNPALTRGPGGQWLDGKGPAISTLTSDQLAAFDVGRLQPESRYARRFPQQEARDGTRIPALAQVFDLVRANGHRLVRFNIETKIGPDAPEATPDPATFASMLVDAVRKAGLAERTAIQSFDWRTLKEVQRIAPEIPTVYLTAQRNWLDNVKAGQPGASPWTAGADVDDFASLPAMLKAMGAQVWSPYWRDLTNDSLADAHGLGLRVVVWTVNDPGDMDRLIAMGVDGIISDYPDRLLRILTEKGYKKRPDSAFFYPTP
jgi:glycerophosphoryl diester phosphodiesterase